MKRRDSIRNALLLTALLPLLVLAGPHRARHVQVSPS